MKEYKSEQVYKIIMSPSSLKKLRDLEKPLRKRIGQRIEQLATTPRHRQSRKLKGEDNIYRNRVGDYRIIYKIQDDELTVLVLDVGHRREIYDRD